MPQLVRSATLSGFAELAVALGQNPQRLAAEAGVPARALSDPDQKLDSAAVGRLLERTAALAGAEDLGLRLAETRRLSNLGPVGLIARDQPTLRKALEVIGQYLWLHNEALSIAVEDAGDLAVVRVELSGAGLVRQGRELKVGALCIILRQLLGPAWRPQAVLLRHAPARDLATHRRVLGVTPDFLQAFDAVALRQADLDAPLASSDPAMARQAERFVGGLADGRGRSVRDLAGDLIVLLLPTGACSADRVAQHLGCERRTLHRRLAAEGTSYRALLEARRRELTASLVASPRPLAEVADVAGFASLSGLSHWFQRRFGTSPSAYRASPPGA